MSQWQDIFSVSSWEIIRGVNKVTVVDDDRQTSEVYIKADISSDLTHVEHALLKDIDSLLPQYHAIDKQDIYQFELRIKHLKMIEQVTGEYINLRDKTLHSKNGKKLNPVMTQDPITHKNLRRSVRTQSKFKPQLEDYAKTGLGSIDIWITSLHNRCKTKSAYLKSLQSFTHDHPECNRRNMIAEVINKNHSDGELYPGVWLEKIDFLHRQIEFTPHTMIQQDYNHDLPMNKAFNQWYHSQLDIPFYVWLEGHSISTSHQLLNRDYRPVESIDYTLENKKIVTINSSLLVEKQNSNGESNNEILVFRSKSMLPKKNNLNTNQNCFWKALSDPDSVAFVWDINDENQFYTHPHLVGKYHHASLVGGNNVRCAGMWKVEAGKDTYLSNSSGHYRSSHASFFKLVNYLKQNDVLDSNVKIQDMLYILENQNVSLSQYLSSSQNSLNLFKNS